MLVNTRDNVKAFECITYLNKKLSEMKDQKVIGDYSIKLVGDRIEFRILGEPSIPICVPKTGEYDEDNGEYDEVNQVEDNYRSFDISGFEDFSNIFLQIIGAINDK